LDAVDGTTPRINLPNGIMDTGNYFSIDPNSRILYASDGSTPSINWESGYLGITADYKSSDEFTFLTHARALDNVNLYFGDDGSAEVFGGF
jgi:hypothetical protein